MLVFSLLGVGCGQGSSPSPRDARKDNQINVSLPEVPPGCPPDVGNENGIGAPCTANGGECSGSLTCACDDRFGYRMPAGMPCFCTNLIFGTTCSACGSNAACCRCNIALTDPPFTVSACFPSVCLNDGECPVVEGLSCTGG